MEISSMSNRAKGKFRGFTYWKQNTPDQEVRGVKISGVYSDKKNPSGGYYLKFLDFPKGARQSQSWQKVINDLTHLDENTEWVVSWDDVQNGNYINHIMKSLVPADSVAPIVNAPMPQQAPRGLVKPPQPVHSQQFRTPEQSMVSDLCAAYLQSGLAEANTETLDLIAEWAHEYIEGRRPFQGQGGGRSAPQGPVQGVDPHGTDPGGQDYEGGYDVPF
jgi:hypothetical protein